MAATSHSRSAVALKREDWLIFYEPYRTTLTSGVGRPFSFLELDDVLVLACVSKYRSTACRSCQMQKSCEANLSLAPVLRCCILITRRSLAKKLRIACQRTCLLQIFVNIRPFSILVSEKYHSYPTSKATKND